MQLNIKVEKLKFIWSIISYLFSKSTIDYIINRYDLQNIEDIFMWNIEKKKRIIYLRALNYVYIIVDLLVQWFNLVIFCDSEHVYCYCVLI